jgi:hypothetical protein
MWEDTAISERVHALDQINITKLKEVFVLHCAPGTFILTMKAVVIASF